MKTSIKLAMAGLLATVALPGLAIAQQYSAPGSTTSDRVLTPAELNDLVSRSRASGAAVSGDVDVRYLGAATEMAAESIQCCENVQEQVRRETQVEETVVGVDAVTEREIIQPVERTIIQPIERRIVQGRMETVTEDTRFETERLDTIVQADPVPPVRESIIEQPTTQTREEVTETFYDVVTRRDVIQPVERVTVVPVERKVVRPRTETVTADTRFETVRAPVQVEAEPIPSTREYITEQVTTLTQDQVTETFVDVVTQRDVVQPVERTIIQPIERRILRGTTETVTAPTQFREEVLPVRVETTPAPEVVENLIPQVTERTVFEVTDVFVDQVTRNVIQPVVITTIQPIERRVIRGRKETVTNAVRFEQEVLPGRVEAEPIPQTNVNFIPQVTVQEREEVIETFFDAVTQRDVIQPIVTTLVQPIERRLPRARTETVTSPVRYETVRASMVSMDLGSVCTCTDTMTRIASDTASPVTEMVKDCE